MTTIAESPYLHDECDTSTSVSPAIVIADADAEHWDARCDVLVVGCGLAGTTATLRAAEDASLEVYAVDRGDCGGASGLSGGVLYLGGTRVQQDVGVEDSAEAMARYLSHETGDVVRPETVRRFAEQSGTMIPWLERYGARFGGPLSTAKTNYPGTSFLYYSGNEKTPAGRALAPPAPRGHRALPVVSGKKTAMSGRELMTPLIAAMDAAVNITVLRQTAARRLIVDGEGRVVGVELWRIPTGSRAARRHRRMMSIGKNMIAAILGLSGWAGRAATKLERAHARPMRVRVRRGVVLSAGGFIFNPTMLAHAAPKYVGVAPIGTIGDDGSGIKLGTTAGGATDRMSTVSAWRFLYAPASWTKSVAIGPDGERLVSEEEYGARTGEALFERAGGSGWLILDHPLQAQVEKEAKSKELLLFQKLPVRASVRKYTVSAASLEALAGKIGVPVDRLKATIARYNEAIHTGEPDAFGKSEELRVPIETGPFYATDISASTKFSPIPAVTMGGLRVDEESGAVLARNGTMIDGLYAAGRNAIGLCSHFYVSGLSLADCVFSGLRAADSLRDRAGDGPGQRKQGGS